MDGERRGGRARVRAGRKGVGRSAEGRMRSAEWCPCAVHVSRFTFHASRFTGSHRPLARNDPLPLPASARPPAFPGASVPYRLPNLNPNPNLGSLPPSPDSLFWPLGGTLGGVLLKSSARVKVGRAVPSAPWEVAKACSSRTSLDARGALRTARPTADLLFIDPINIAISFFDLAAAGRGAYDAATISLWKATYCWSWSSLGFPSPWLSGLSRGRLAPGKALRSLDAASAHWNGKFPG